MTDKTAYYFIHEVGLTLGEVAIAIALYSAKGYCTRDRLQEALDPINKAQFSEDGAERNVDSHIKRMRPKFFKQGLTIQTLYGLGYILSDEVKANIESEISKLPMPLVIDDKYKLAYRTFGFSKTEIDIMNMLLCAKTICSREQLLNGVGLGDIFDRTIDSHIKRMRHKLMGTHIEISTYYGFGYYLTDENKLKAIKWNKDYSPIILLPAPATSKVAHGVLEQARM